MTVLVAPPESRTEAKVLLMHRVVFHEIPESRLPVVDLQGKLWGGPDRRGMNAPDRNLCFSHWQRQVGVASAMGVVPEEVMTYFHATKGLGHAPNKEDVINITEEDDVRQVEPDKVGAALWEIDGDPFTVEGIGGTFTPTTSGKTQKILANPPRFATSYSGMKDFLNCPAKWAAAKYFKTLPYIEGPEAAWGNRVHKAMENVLTNIIIADDIKIIKENGWEKYLKAILFAKKNGALVEVEKELCFTKDLRKCGWKDWNTVWFRFKGDVHVVKGAKFFYYDWKTGKRFSSRGDDQADDFQLEVAWATVSLYHPEIEEFVGTLLFLKEKDLANVVVQRRYTKADLPRIWEKIFAITSRMEAAWETENFRMQTSGLCKKHCGNANCPHCGKGGR